MREPSLSSSTKAVRTAAAGGAVMTLGAALVGVANPAAGGPPAAIVTDEGDSGPGTLRQAIEDANAAAGPDIVTFDPGLGTIELDSQIEITDEVLINGPVTISGGGDSRIFYINTDGRVSLSVLTLQDGSADQGGAVWVYDVDLFVLGEVTITGSDATDGNGGGLLVTGGSDIEFHQSRFSGNTASSNGGGAYIHTDDQVVVVSHSTFDDNDAGGNGGGLMTHHVYDVAVDISTFSNNTAEHSGGGAYLGAEGGNLRITSTTVSGNDALDGGGGGLFAYGFDYIEIAHSTIADNEARTYGGGAAIYEADEVTIDHTLIGGNSAPDYADLAVYDTDVVTVMNSLVQADVGPAPFQDAGRNVLGEDPGLAALANNGGLTRTHALTATSPAIDGGDPGFIGPPFVDQRGEPRVEGEAIDIGAYEAKPEDPTPRSAEPPAAQPAEGTPTFTG